MAECFYCEKDNEKRKALMLDVCELPYSIVYLFRDQKNKGRCVVAFKGHKTEYFQLTPEENAGYFADVAKVAKVLDELYHPDKINYATYGDGMPHVHVHIVPKYKGGVSWGQPLQRQPAQGAADRRRVRRHDRRPARKAAVIFTCPGPSGDALLPGGLFVCPKGPILPKRLRSPGALRIMIDVLLCPKNV